DKVIYDDRSGHRSKAEKINAGWSGSRCVGIILVIARDPVADNHIVAEHHGRSAGRYASHSRRSMVVHGHTWLAIAGELVVHDHVGISLCARSRSKDAHSCSAIFGHNIARDGVLEYARPAVRRQSDSAIRHI